MYKLLYIISMESILAEIFANKAQVRILMTLASCPSGLSLRLLSRVSKCELRSAQLVVQVLLKQRVLQKSKVSNAIVYRLSEKHEWFSLIKSIAQQEREFMLAKRAKTFAKRAQRQFEFCKEAAQFVKS